MRIVIALLAIIALILLGLFGPILYGIALALVTAAPTLMTIAGLFLAGVVIIVIYHAANGTL